MRFLVPLATAALFALLAPSVVEAQGGPPPAPRRPGNRPATPAAPAEPAEEPAQEEPAEPGAEASPDEAPSLRAPTAEPIAPPTDPDEAGAPESAPSEEDDDVPSPSDAADMLEQGAPEVEQTTDASGTSKGGWSIPVPTLTLHGYLRGRGELWDTFWLGRQSSRVDAEPPFSRFLPGERGVRPQGGCGDNASTDPDRQSSCDRDSLSFANMRLRLTPTLSLGEDVRVHAMFDVFDNMVLGSTPGASAWIPDNGGTRTSASGSTFDGYSTSAYPPVAGRNSLQDSIVAKRAWAEVSNRTLGQLRFGRMGSHWGLGILDNGGDGIDSDFQTDVDRLMATTKLAGFYISAGYDFASEGYVQHDLRDLQGLPYDIVQEDDLDQYMLQLAYKMDPEEQKEALERGDWVLNGGLYFMYRRQFLTSEAVTPINATDETFEQGTLVRRDAHVFMPDLWAQFLWRSLRIELEASFIGGTIGNLNAESFENRRYRALMFGGALEMEYRLLDEKLGIYLDSGIATGDADVDGLTATPGAFQNGDRTISTYRFHPNYRVDLILWRNIMQRISGAYYFRPGISYDVIRSPFGQRLGGRVNLIWSRATEPVQTWGAEADLGVEINASIYYQSEDGPALYDGFHAMVQYGILFPMAGLGYLSDGGVDEVPGGNPDLKNAQILRLLLGVHY